MSSALVKSGADLGSIVHDQLETKVAAEFVVRHPDKILVAEENVYIPSSTSFVPVARKLEDVSAILEKLDNDYSLRVLLQSRGSKAPQYARAKDAKTSREDLVVFSGISPAILPTGLGLDGRPEVFEVKPIDSLIDAVSQVTIYSWNYLMANMYWKCMRLSKAPKAIISNPVMLPADPNRNTLFFPALSIGTLVGLGAAGVNPDKVAEIVQSLLSKMIPVAQYIAFPFMAEGLYGIIPYFVIDKKQMMKELTKVLQAIIAAMILALVAYLTAKKLADEVKETLEQLARALEAFLEVVLLIAACIAFVVALLMIAAEATAVLVAILLESELIAAVPIPVVAFGSQAHAEPAGNGQANSGGEPSVASFDIFLGNIRAMGIPTEKFGEWISQAAILFRDLWSQAVERSTVDVAPPG